ncbi:MAG: SUMF1/EgtB/PvdO family nonheme iron enzyme [Treponema sp.]|nr:SUMF1/EgtB/PvdO family nonheme iron enzyme [Treponema sp.]
MFAKNEKCVSKLILTLMCLALFAANASAKPKSELVKEEAGYYYGYGKAGSNEDACAIAKKDLLESALTSTLRLSDPEADNITVTEDTVKERFTDIKPFFQSKNGQSVTYRIKVSEFEKDEKQYAAKLRAKLAPLYNVVSGKGNIGTRMSKAIEILQILSDCGETNLLTMQEKGTELYSAKVESLCSAAINELTYKFSEKDKIIPSTTQLTLTVKDKSGKAVTDLPLKAVWSMPYLSISTGSEEIAEVVSYVTTDAAGNAVIDYPIADEYKNKIVCLEVSIAFATIELPTAPMRRLQNESTTEARYLGISSFDDMFKSVEVKAGTYTTGAIASDTRANPKEKSRTAKVKAYRIDTDPVTNLQFAAFIYLTRSEEEPEYFSNSDYNAAQQPVVGVSVKMAEAYAKWLSEQTGSKYRLPTDDEWEIAARANTDYIYPWGNDDPSKGKKANYKGNGKFKKPSPVGSFADSTNAWGLEDMAGNVWEWTGTARNETADSSSATVKGGSWMDGPVDLRISNFKNIDKESGYPDVGFRLIKEVTK